METRSSVAINASIPPEDRARIKAKRDAGRDPLDSHIEIKEVK